MRAVCRFALTLTVTVRACRAADLPKLEWFGAFRHHRAFIREAFELQARGEALMLVADAGGFPIGQAWLQLRRGGVPTVWAVRVLEPFQNRGVGVRLMKALDEAAASLGHCELELSVEQDNPRARAFYERLGWRLAGERRESRDHTTAQDRAVAQDQREWVMTKRLDDARAKSSGLSASQSWPPEPRSRASGNTAESLGQGRRRRPVSVSSTRAKPHP